MKLTIKDRLTLHVFFPKEACLTDQLIVRDINKKISITQEEVEKFEIKCQSIKGQQNTATSWNPEKAEDVDIELTNMEIRFLKDAVRRLDEEKKITPELVDLCIKIKDFEINES